MRVLLSYPSEVDKGEGMHYARALQRMGHEVCQVNVASSFRGKNLPGRIIKGYCADVTLTDLMDVHGSPDLFLYIEPLGLLPRGMDTSPIPMACVISDTHRNLRARQKLARLFDHVFLYHRNYVRHFQEHPQGAVHWLPYACDTECFCDLGLPRDLDIAFIGQLFKPRSRRRRIVDALGQRYSLNEQRYYRQEEIPKIYSRTKIVLNLPAADDLNFRVFEAMSCGALLVTERIASGQEELFQEDVHYVAFNGEKELFDKIEHYLEHEDQRLKIAQAGHEEVMQHHTLDLRLRTLLEKVRTGPQDGAPVRRMPPTEVRRLYASVYERAGRVDALLTMAAEQRHDLGARLWLLVMATKSFLRRAILGW